jgi:hypothetical protein
MIRHNKEQHSICGLRETLGELQKNLIVWDFNSDQGEEASSVHIFLSKFFIERVPAR